ncbi:MAG: hypothetical protein K940chlam7_01991 [Chlamydiae bacterium]|nr:hypothetical protein [Chlamydiota bacterium]
MSKANYSKVEGALSKGLHKIKVGNLLKKTDKPSKKREKEGVLTPKQMMTIVEQDIKWMHKEDPDIYKNLKIKKSEIQKLMNKVQESPKSLKETDLEHIQQIKEKVSKYKKESFPSHPDEEIVKSQRKKHIYKRHNVPDKWVPLDTHADIENYEGD